MEIEYNSLKLPDSQNIILCNPTMEEIAFLNVESANVKLRLGSLSELSLTVPKYITNSSGERIEQEGYKLLESKRLIFIDRIGWFQIKNIKESVNSDGEIKTVSAESHEARLKDKGFTVEERAYCFYNPSDPTDSKYNSENVESIPSVIGQLYQQLGIRCNLVADADTIYNEWTVNYIEEDLYYYKDNTNNTIRSLQKNSTTGYDFLLNTTEEAFNVIWIMDILRHSIQVKHISSITKDTDIYMSFSNLVNGINVTENADNIITVLNCKGGNNLSIGTVNPMGVDYIVNFDYYKDRINGKWMSTELIELLDKWEELYKKSQDDYANFVIELQNEYYKLNNEVAKRDELDLTLQELEAATDNYRVTSKAILCETIYEYGDTSLNPNSKYNEQSLNSEEKLVGHTEPPTLRYENNKSFYFYDESGKTDTMENLFNSNHKYLLDEGEDGLSNTYLKIDSEYGANLKSTSLDKNYITFNQKVFKDKLKIVDTKSSNGISYSFIHKKNYINAVTRQDLYAYKISKRKFRGSLFGAWKDKWDIDGKTIEGSMWPFDDKTCVHINKRPITDITVTCGDGVFVGQYQEVYVNFDVPFTFHPSGDTEIWEDRVISGGFSSVSIGNVPNMELNIKSKSTDEITFTITEEIVDKEAYWESKWYIIDNSKINEYYTKDKDGNDKLDFSKLTEVKLSDYGVTLSKISIDELNTGDIITVGYDYIFKADRYGTYSDVKEWSSTDKVERGAIVCAEKVDNNKNSLDENSLYYVNKYGKPYNIQGNAIANVTISEDFNKNWFNFSNIPDDIVRANGDPIIKNLNNETLTFKAWNYDNYANLIDVVLEPNTTYTYNVNSTNLYQLYLFSEDFYPISANGYISSSTSHYDAPLTFTTGATGKVMVRLDNEGGADSINIFSNIYINKGHISYAKPQTFYYKTQKLNPDGSVKSVAGWYNDSYKNGQEPINLENEGITVEQKVLTKDNYGNPVKYFEFSDDCKFTISGNIYRKRVCSQKIPYIKGEDFTFIKIKTSTKGMQITPSGGLTNASIKTFNQEQFSQMCSDSAKYTFIYNNKEWNLVKVKTGETVSYTAKNVELFKYGILLEDNVILANNNKIEILNTVGIGSASVVDENKYIINSYTNIKSTNNVFIFNNNVWEVYNSDIKISNSQLESVYGIKTAKTPSQDDIINITCDCIYETFSNCINKNYLYFIDGNNNSYCKLKAYSVVNSNNNTAKYFADGFYRYILCEDAAGENGWTNKHNKELQELNNTISKLEEDIEEITQQMSSIAESCNIRKYILREGGSRGTDLLKELDCYWIQGDYENSTYSVNTDTPMEEQINISKELLKVGEQELARVSQPSFSFTIDAIDFTKNITYREFAKQLELGCVISVEKEDGVVYRPAVTEIAFNLFNGDGLTLTFSNSVRLTDSIFTLADLVKKASDTTKTITSNWQNLVEYTKEKENIKNLIESPLDMTLRAAQANMSKQEFVVDESGILGRKFEDDSKTSFNDEQIRIINNVLLFTDDGWETSKTALGRIYYTDSEGNTVSSYGLVAETIIGDLIIGDKINIRNENNSIILGNNGLEIFNNKKEKVFYADGDGNLHIIGTLDVDYGADIGGFSIGSDSLYSNIDNENNRVILSKGTNITTPITNADTLNNWMIVAGKNFGVLNNGDMYANSGYIAGFKIYTTAEQNGIYSKDDLFKIKSNSLPWEDKPSGLYNNGQIVKTWNELKNGGYITISSGALTGNDSFKNSGFTGILYIDKEVTKINSNAFKEHTELKGVYIPGSVNSIGIDAFNGCGNISDVRIGEGVEIINNYAFQSNKLTILKLPQSLKIIGDGAFNSSVDGLTEIIIPDNVSEIGYGAFVGGVGSSASNVKKIKIGVNVTSIKDNCFRGHINLEELNLGNVSQIYANAFYCSNATKLNKVVIPKTMRYFGATIFGGRTIDLYIESTSSEISNYMADTASPSSWNSRTSGKNYFGYTGVGKANPYEISFGQPNIYNGIDYVTKIGNYGITSSNLVTYNLSVKNSMSVSDINVTNVNSEKVYTAQLFRHQNSSWVSNIGASSSYWDNAYVHNVFTDSGSVSKSDKNVKNSINLLSEKYSNIFDKLTPVSFKYNNGNSGRIHTGLIAQELKQVIEECGLTTQDMAAYVEYGEGDNKTCGIRYEELISLCIDQIQKLKIRVKELEERNN